MRKPIAILALFLLPTLCVANNDYRLTIINHFDSSLQYTIGINPQVLPDFAKTFTLDKEAQTSSKIEDIQKEAYLRVEDGTGKSAFWGVNIENNRVVIHGYLSKAIAYSWKADTITFCTPDEYKKNKGCL